MYQPLQRSFSWTHPVRKKGALTPRPFTIEPTPKEAEAENPARHLAEMVERASRFGHNLASFRPASPPVEGSGGASAPGVIQLNGKDNKRKRDSGAGTKEKKKRKKSDFPDKTFDELGTDWTSYGANQSRVFFKTKKSKSKDANPHGLSSNKVSKIFKQTENVVGPKKYAGLQEKQALRWMSTIAFRYLNKGEKDPREVQSALLDKLYMATNTGKGNKALEALVKEVSKEKKPGLELMRSMYSSIKDEKDLTRREKRHLKKFNKRILDDTTSSSYKDYESIHKALEEPVTIASEGEEGLHAERRIGLKAGQKTLPPKKVGGVKRPCTNCYMSLYPTEKDVHPGPYWPSKAANLGFGNYEKDAKALAGELEKIPGTFATLVKDEQGRKNKNTVTFDYDTDSDSEGES